jgi:hypothetical protein
MLTAKFLMGLVLAHFKIFFAFLIDPKKFSATHLLFVLLKYYSIMVAPPLFCMYALLVSVAS